MPATLEALLRLVLDLEPEPQAGISASGLNPWKLVAWTSLAWIAVLGITVAGFLRALERQDRKLELLLQRTTPVEKQAE